jgi:teichoic acid transport system permease protein
VSDRDLASIARTAGLTRVGARPDLLAYLRQAWQRRGFARTLAWYRIESSNSQNRFGMFWLVGKPLLNAAVYGFAFGIILPSDTRPPNFVPFLVIGVFLMEFFSKAFGDGAKSITSNSQLVRSLSFPRILLPLSTALEACFTMLAMLVIMLPVALLWGEPLTPRWLLIIPTLLLAAIFNTGVGLIAARLTVHFRDFSQVIPFVNRLLLYTTGIFYSIEKVGVKSNHPELVQIARLNPLHDYISLVRYALMRDQFYTPVYWIVGGVGALVAIVLGVIFFWAAEERYGRD